jgi:hypothetical protein
LGTVHIRFTAGDCGFSCCGDTTGGDYGKHQNAAEEFNASYLKNTRFPSYAASRRRRRFHDLGNLIFTFIADAGETGTLIEVLRIPWWKP